jgi:hypothetical protein
MVWRPYSSLLLHRPGRQSLHHEVLAQEGQHSHRDGGQHGSSHELAPDVRVATTSIDHLMGTVMAR